MRNTTICRIQLHPSTEESAFEHGVLETVFPVAGDRPREADRLFVRSLYRARTEEFPPVYACLVDSLFSADSNFFGMRGGLTDLGATVSRPPQMWPLAGSLPDDAAATAAESAFAQSPALPDLLMVTLRLPLDRSSEAFEAVLTKTFADVIATGSTRTNGVTSARWYRDDSTDHSDIRYLCKATGYFSVPELFRGWEDRLLDAGAQVLESTTYTHVSSVSGGVWPPETAAARSGAGRGR